MIRLVSQAIDVPLIVGGGIRSKEQAFNAAAAGAKIIVTGNITETGRVKDKIAEIVEGINAARLRHG